MLDLISLAEQRVRGSLPRFPEQADRWRHAAFRAVYHAALANDPAMERCALGFAEKAARALAWSRMGGDAK